MIGLVVVKLAFGVALAFDMGRVAAVTADEPSYVNVVLNLLSLVALVGGLVMAPRAFRAKRVEGELAQMQRLIEGHKSMAELKEEEATAAREKAAELGGLLDSERTAAAGWQARYEEQSQYTAAPALEAIRRLMEDNALESERRHRETLLVLRSLRALIPGSDEREVAGGA